MSSLAPSAFLASAAGTRELQRRILDQSNTAADDPTFEVVMQQWRTMSNSEAPTDFRQRALDMTVVAKEFDALLSRQTDTHHRARLLAAASEHSGDCCQYRPAVYDSTMKPFGLPLTFASVAACVNPTNVLVAP